MKKLLFCIDKGDAFINLAHVQSTTYNFEYSRIKLNRKRY